MTLLRARAPQKRPRNHKNFLSVLLPLALAGGSLFGLYFWQLYSHLNTAFNQQEQFSPSRIFSDTSHIFHGLLRSRIEEKLKPRGYTYSLHGSTLRFTLHPIDYPTYLLPDGHPQIEAHNADVSFEFEGPASSSPLARIRLGEVEVPDLYLEPELVATLSKSSDTKREIRTSLKFEEIPANVWKAIISIEDQHFLEHKGLDPRGLARAIWVNLKTMSLAQGGSTITQQLVKNLMARRTKNIFQKWNELFLAILLEAKYDKEQILARYLNEVYLGQVGNLEVHGVAQGAEHFFGKKLEDLNLSEISLMAGLIRGPGFYSPYRYRARALERQRLVLKKMVETGQISEEEAQASTQLPIRLAPPKSGAVKAPFFVDYVKAELVKLLSKSISEQEIPEAGLKIYTTLDESLNISGQKSVSEGIQELEKQFKLGQSQHLEGALASVEHSTGYIRALIGGRNYSQSTFNRILNMKRQVGSTFKPLVYLTAFQKGMDEHGVMYGPAYLTEDAPWTLTYDHGKQTWSPKNYEKSHLGIIPLRTAFAHSINTVAAKLGNEVGIENVAETAKRLGVISPLPIVPSLALGVAELSPLELLQVYATLANRGTQTPLTVIRGISDRDGKEYARYLQHPTPVFDSASIDLTTYLLQKVISEGTARRALAMGFNRPAAGKTGTTSNYRDAWFAGYTPHLTTVVWVGMDQYTQDVPTDSKVKTGKKKQELALTGANSALPIWVNYMKNAHAGLPPEEFFNSPLLTEIEIDKTTGKPPTFGTPASSIVIEKYIRH